MEEREQRSGAQLRHRLSTAARLRGHVELLRAERAGLRAEVGRVREEREGLRRDIAALRQRMAAMEGARAAARSVRSQLRSSAAAARAQIEAAAREQRRRSDHQGALRRFLRAKERPRDPPGHPRGETPPISGDVTEGDPHVEEEEEEEGMEAPCRPLALCILLGEQHRELQQLQRRREQLQAALRAAVDADPDVGGPGGRPPPSPGAEERLEGEGRELRGRAARGRSLLRHVTEGLKALLAQLGPEAEVESEPEPDVLQSLLCRLEDGVIRLLRQVPAGDAHLENAPFWGRVPTPPRPPSPREEEEEEERPLSPTELRGRILSEVLRREEAPPPARSSAPPEL